jgi:hypothetical protein
MSSLNEPHDNVGRPANAIHAVLVILLSVCALPLVLRAYPCDVYACQAMKGVGTSYGALSTIAGKVRGLACCRIVWAIVLLPYVQPFYPAIISEGSVA